MRGPYFKETCSYWIVLTCILQSTNAQAISLNFADFQNAASLLAANATTAVVKTVGLAGDYRTLQSVQGPSGLFGLDFGASVMVSQVPPEFLDALQSAGYSKPQFAAIPAPHLRVSKRLTEYLSVDGGYASYKGFRLLGVGIQAFTDIEEGPDFAFRLSYSKNDLGIVSTKTFTPSIMMGKRLSFFEPYIGVGYQMTVGTIDIPLNYLNYSLNVKATAKINTFTTFAGMVMNLFLLQIAFEGNYSAAGVPGVGVKVGLRF